MAKYKLLTQHGYDELKKDMIYDEHHICNGNFSVIELVQDYPGDWEEVTEEPDYKEIAKELLQISEDIYVILCSYPDFHELEYKKKFRKLGVTIKKAHDAGL